MLLSNSTRSITDKTCKWTMKMKCMVVIMITSACTVCIGVDQCPPQLVQTLYASTKCVNPRYYHCLWDGLTDQYNELCFPAEFYTPGSYVISENALNAKRCPVNRYQPFAYWTNETNRCIYLKSQCTEKGQTVSDLGTTTDDASCKCDYMKGYSYVLPPKDPCRCIPAEEDCSCYLKKCLNESYELSPDYNCELVNLDVVRKYRCPRISTTSYTSNHESMAKNSSDDNQLSVSRADIILQNVYRPSVDTKFVARVTTGAVVVVVCIFIAWFSILVYYDDGPRSSEMTQLKAQSNNIYDNIIKDGTFYCTTAFIKAKDFLENNSSIILKGKQGSGKSTLAIHLASVYIKKDYKLRVLFYKDAHLLKSIQKSDTKYIIVLEEWLNSCNQELKSIIEIIYSSLNQNNEYKLIMTLSDIDGRLSGRYKTSVWCNETNTLDLDNTSSLTLEDKRSMLRCYLKRFNRRLNDDDINLISASETYHSFPFLCVQFCNSQVNFNLQSKFFRQPPSSLVDKINILRHSGYNDRRNRVEYCVLVYALLNSENSSIPTSDINRGLIKDIMTKSFNIKVIKDTNVSESDIRECCRSMCPQYLQVTSDEKYVLHPVVYQAVLVSYAEIHFKDVVSKCSLHHLFDIVRPSTYVKIENELMLRVNNNDSRDCLTVLAERIADVMFLEEEQMHLAVQFIIKYEFKEVLIRVVQRLENKVKLIITEKRVEHLKAVFKQLTKNCTDLHLLNFIPTNFALTWAIIVLQQHGAIYLLDTLVDRFIIQSNQQVLIGILENIVDEYKNTVLHMSILWWANNENPFISHLIQYFRAAMKSSRENTEKLLSLKNNKDMSALDFAAYFLNHEAVDIFLKLHIKHLKNQILPAAKKDKLKTKVNEYIQMAESIHPFIFINGNICRDINHAAFDFDKTMEVYKTYLKN